jgi:hypothetical protein
MSILNSQLDIFERPPRSDELMGHLSVLSNPQYNGTDVEKVSPQCRIFVVHNDLISWPVFEMARDSLLAKALEEGGFDRQQGGIPGSAFHARLTFVDLVVELLVDEFQEQHSSWPRGYRTVCLLTDKSTHYSHNIPRRNKGGAS